MAPYPQQGMTVGMVEEEADLESIEMMGDYETKSSGTSLSKRALLANNSTSTKLEPSSSAANEDDVAPWEAAREMQAAQMSLFPADKPLEQEELMLFYKSYGCVVLTIALANALVAAFVHVILPPHGTAAEESAGQGAPLKANDQPSTVLGSSSSSSASTTTWTATDSIPSAGMNGDEFYVYAGFFIWFTMTILGLCMEFFVYVVFLRKQPWTRTRETVWRLTQALYTLAGITSLGLALSGNYLALILMTLTIWKWGFPEILTYFMHALGRYGSRASKATSWVYGVGLVMHHTGACMAIAFITVGVIPLNRHVMAVFLPTLQHWYVLLRYVSPTVYTIVRMISEMWLEWCMISNFQYLHALHWSASHVNSIMLLAQWTCVLGSALEIALTYDSGCGGSSSWFGCCQQKQQRRSKTHKHTEKPSSFRSKKKSPNTKTLQKQGTTLLEDSTVFGSTPLESDEDITATDHDQRLDLVERALDTDSTEEILFYESSAFMHET